MNNPKSKTVWLHNVPEDTKRLTFFTDSVRREAFEDMLAFVQRDQPRATRADLLEHIYTTALNRKGHTPPAPLQKARMSADLPESVVSEIEDTLVRLGELHGTRYTHQDFWTYAWGYYTSRQHPKIKDWKRDVRERERAAKQGSKQELGHEETPTEPKADRAPTPHGDTPLSSGSQAGVESDPETSGNPSKTSPSMAHTPHT